MIRKAALLATAAICLSASVASADEPASPPHPAASTNPELQAAEALANMSAEEKLSLIHGQMLGFVAPNRRPEGVALGGGYVPGVPRLGVTPLVETDASLGVANLMDLRKGDVATALPSGLAQAATWDPALIRESGRMIGGEAKAKGFNVMLAGGVNLVRDPRNGRNFEYLGEDPLLAGRLVAAQIDGIQSNHIISTIKHFALNNQETGRSSASANMAEAAMRESDLLTFELGIEGGKPGAVMCSYNRVNSVFACENSFLLTEVLRRDWGYKGFVMSDWGAVHSVKALTAGLDQESGEQIDTKRFFSTELAKALASGEIPASAVDTAASRILYSIYAHGLAGHPVSARSPIDYDADGAVALKAAEQGIVLLRNQGGILPLASNAKRIVLIGGHADIGVLSGGGSSQVTPVGGVKLFENAGNGPASGFARKIYGGTPPLEGLRRAFPQAEITYLDGKDEAAATAAARQADIAIVVAEKFASEAEDNKDLSLDGNQDALISAVAEANPKTVVVLEVGNPVLMPWRDKVPAIVAAWFPGQRGGDAIAQVLAGEVNPSGHLPVTFPASTAQLPNPVLPGSNLPPPSAADRATYGINVNSPPFDIAYPEGSDVGYRWFDRKGEKPLYPFGFGLSYTSFGYDRLKASGGKTVTVSFRVTNTGKVAGADVPQVYVVLPGKAKRLIGWDKPVLKPGESRTVTVTADQRLLASFDAHRQRWVVPAGMVKVEVSRSAAAPVLTARVAIAHSEMKP